MKKRLRKDVDAFYFAASMVELLSPAGARRLRPMDVIEHFDGVVLGELDLRLESLHRHRSSPPTPATIQGFELPDIKWHSSSRRVMTMGWADGVPLGDNAALDAAGHDRVALGRNGCLQLFLQPRFARRVFPRRHASGQPEGRGQRQHHRL